MEEIESAGVMAEEEDATNVEDEIEIGMDVVDRYGWINMVHQREPTTE